MQEGRPRIPNEIYLDMQADAIKYRRELNLNVSVPDLIAATWIVAGNHPKEIVNELRRMKGNPNAAG